MKEKYEEMHDKLVEVKRARATANKKLTSQKKILTEMKEILQKAEMRVEVAENNFKDANLQLALKVARPISQAQVKLENAQEDYANEMTHLRALLAQKEADMTAAEEARIAAEAKLEELRVTGAFQTPETLPQDSAVQSDSDELQRLLEISEFSANELAATNTQLEEDIKGLEAKVGDLTQQITTIDAAFATEKAFLLGENEKLKADKQMLEQRAVKQKAMLDRIVNDL